ncbi:MAG: mannitol dehydrogenase family protein [Lachnospiraceae bacterium]|nr:mannitol dehydrogenase family protein [Lachnospiraceae bacterium]
MKLNLEALKDKSFWENAGIELPEFDAAEASKETFKNPVWVHFGAGSLFRAFHAIVMQNLMNKGLSKSGVIAAETFDYEMVDLSYAPYDNLGIQVSLMPDGRLKKTLIGSVAGALKCDASFNEDMAQLEDIFRNPSLQMVTFTITEKGYALKDMHGEFTGLALKDFENGPESCAHAMSKVTALLYKRFNAGGTPVAMVSTDNCSRNGEKLRNAIITVAEEWAKKGFVTTEFVSWVSDENKVSFPWTTIDKITPRPAQVVADELKAAGIEGMEVQITGKGGYTAAFVNAEKPQYLVIEDRFPNGRPELDKAGVYLTDRDTVNKFERMKVCTCLNPLHTALAVYGCLLCYTSIASEMTSPQLKTLVEKIGYQEGMPVVTDPGIIKPEAFIKEVIEERLPNPFMPDTPQRIACDTSQKVPIRFGETLKSYAENEKADNRNVKLTSVAELTYVPLAIAGWMRYLLGVDDNGDKFECSSDPLLLQLQEMLSGVRFGEPDSVNEDVLKPILSNKNLFTVDLCEIGLSGKITGMVKEMLKGKGAVLETLKKYTA